MTKFIDNLRNDHRNLFKLLTLLQHQADKLERGEYTDYQLISDIMRYFVTFPDIYHHPHEDLIFDAVKDKDKRRAAIVDQITRQHQDMARDATDLLDEITQIQGNAIFSREALVKRIRDYISLYHAHIDQEERELFNCAEQTLEDADWKRIQTAVQVASDPLFGKNQKDDYQNLFRAILAEVVDG